ncbi:response regulator transcription factor [Bordetella genomosp. 13]|uniref:DNA-binding response regulator n=1 Tax=Bordetella genomosp. 13 TaxID=463040 RepID=A0A1W6Z903_9BORD|nr:response regulator [Bordetella genomosp. 13]ARP93809.1 DNA-binding response regulator [Bordetella genomosp. 13]
MRDDIPVVFVVDDDDAARRALTRVICSAGYRVQGYDSAIEFLELRPSLGSPSCLVLDVHLPGMDGLDLQRRLIAANVSLPIIFITGHGDIPSVVRAMKAGAADFLGKPVDAHDLLLAVDTALRNAAQALAFDTEANRTRHLAARLTGREREVLGLLVRGRLNKQAAYELGIAEKTVKVHRARVMEKMEARSLVELARAVDKAGITL